jgi:hypothetical protein
MTEEEIKRILYPKHYGSVRGVSFLTKRIFKYTLVYPNKEADTLYGYIWDELFDCGFLRYEIAAEELRHARAKKRLGYT